MPITAETNSSGQTVLDDASLGPVVGAASAKKGYTICIVGDSIPQAQIGSHPQPLADAGWWYSSTISPSASTFLLNAVYSANCASNESGAIEWNGVSRMRAAIAGDSAGPWVDITGGGFFALTSGTNSKTLFVAIRWRNRSALAAGSVTVTNSGNTYPYGRMGLSGLFSGGLMRSGLLINNKVMNYAIGGDTPADVLNRIGQVIALRPDAVLLMVGVNDLTEAATVIPSIVLRLTSVGIRVILSPTLPRVLGTAPEVANLDAAISACRSLANGSLVQVVDMSTPMRNPNNATGSIECAAQYNVDEIHPSCVATLQRLADVLDPALRQAFPGIGQRRVVNATNAYNSSTNPRGNLIGARAAATGTGGTLGASPVPTGNLPDNWVDLSGGGTAQTSVVYTCKASGSPVPRGDAPGAYWHAQQVIVAGAGTGWRVLRVPLETAPTAGVKYRFRCVMQFVSVTNLNEFEIDIGFTGASAGPGKARVLQIGTLPTTSNAIEDSGILYFESDDFVVPAGTTAANVAFTVGLSSGGGCTLRVADFDFIPL
jgi:lysophospholipase L1-like esterase